MSSAAAIHFPILNLSDTNREAKILTSLSGLVVDEMRQEMVRDVFIKEMELGLSEDYPSGSSLLMENTYIEELTDGTEEGDYLALDLGGTNFRVILLSIQNGRVIEEDVDYYKVPEEKRLGAGEDLFDFLASCIEDFILKKKLQNRKYQLGFTFSFPMIQKAVDVGILTSWTKSFNCSGVVGKDAVQMLKDAIEKRKGIYVHVNSVLNDTTGTLVQGSYLDSRCAIGMILGTGNNACYIEKVANIKKWKGEHREKEVIIDIEWGAFGDNGVLDFLRTKWDEAVDEKSLLKKSYTFEKYFAGKYLGDLVREVLLTLNQDGLFCKNSSEILKRHGALETASISHIEKEALENSERTECVEESLQSFGVEYDSDDIKIFRYICALLAYRGVVLLSLLIGVLIKRMDRDHCTIAIDGSLYEWHPRFKPLLEHLIAIEAPDHSFSLLLTKDGSGKGAGLVAAIEDRIAKRRTQTPPF